MVARVLLSAALLAAFAAGGSQEPIPQIGQPAPEFTLSSDQDSVVTLEQFKGRWVVLYFYPKNFTGGCTLEAQGFERNIKRFHSYGAVVLGVSIDSVGSHREFCAANGLNFRLLSDTSGAVSATYGSLIVRGDMRISARNTFVIDPDGLIAAVFTGVQPASHSDEVLAELERLGRAR